MILVGSRNSSNYAIKNGGGGFGLAGSSGAILKLYILTFLLVSELWYANPFPNAEKAETKM